MYQKFQTVVKLEKNERAKGTDIPHNSSEIFKQGQEMELQVLKTGICFCQAHLKMSTTSQNFETSVVKLSFGNDNVATHNFTRLKQLGEAIVQINAYHPNPKAKHLSAEDMGGLEPTIYLARKARVMLTRNFWTSAGLCNGAMGTVKHIHALLPISSARAITLSLYSNVKLCRGRFKPGIFKLNSYRGCTYRK